MLVSVTTLIQPSSSTDPEMQTAMPSKPVQNRVVRKRKRPALTTSEKEKAPTEKQQAVVRQMEAHIAEVQRCYTLGVEIHNACTRPDQPLGLKQQARLLRIPENTARKYRQIAQTYTQPELNNLYRFFRAQQFALSVTHFFVLIGVADKNLRKTMALDAVEQELSVSGLRKLKKAKIKKPGTAGGRRPDVVKMRNKRELHAAIKFELTRWQRWLAMLLLHEPNINHTLSSTLSDIQALVEKAQELSRS